MLLIKCPWCGAREENEFSYGGEANLVMPSDPDQITDAEWAQYLFFVRILEENIWNNGCIHLDVDVGLMLNETHLVTR